MKVYFFLTVFYSGVAIYSFSQTRNPDSLFSIARQHASLKEYDKAAKMAVQLIHEFPANKEYKLFLGRVYSWKGDYARSVELLAPLVDTVPVNEEALTAIVNTCLWAENYTRTIEYCDLGITTFGSQSVFFRLKKAMALTKSGQDHDALDLVKVVLSGDPLNPEALSLKAFIEQKKKNALVFAYQHTSFRQPGFEPWHFVFAEYKRVFKKITPVIRVNYGNVFAQSAWQLELDLYPKLNASGYLYINAGISDGDYVFPVVRGGMEHYINFKSTELSYGFRYLHFTSEEVLLATGQISCTFKKYQVTYRPFLSLLDKKGYITHTLGLKKSFIPDQSFLQLDVHYGSVPYYFFVLDEFTRINSMRAGIQYQFRIRGGILVRPVFMCEYEEYFPNRYRNRYNIQVVLTKRF